MPLNLNKVHHYERVPGTQLEVRLIRTDPYVRVCAGGGPPLFIQGGQVYAEGGPTVDQFPEWFEGEVAKIAAPVLASVGWGGTPAPVEPLPAAPAPDVRSLLRPAKQWTCPDCQVVMIARKRGFHVAWHRRQARQAAPVLAPVEA